MPASIGPFLPHFFLRRAEKLIAAADENCNGDFSANMCAMVKRRYIGDGHPTLNRNPYNGYINPYYWVDDHPLLY